MRASDIDKAMIFYRRLFGDILNSRQHTIRNMRVRYPVCIAHPVHCVRNWRYLPLL